MARRHYRRRTPIRQTKVYRRGMWQVALGTFALVGFFANSQLVRQSFGWIQNLKNGAQS